MQQAFEPAPSALFGHAPQLSAGTQWVGAAPSVIELTIAAPDALFHALDPAPLHGRDLNDEVEDFIIETAREAPAPQFALVIHVPPDELRCANEDALADAIRAYFARRRDSASRDFRSLMRQGRHTLAVGLSFLFVCGVLAALAQESLPAPAGPFVEQGLLIIGWVANWRPVEIFLYDWRPLRKQRALFDVLSRMSIQFRASDA